MAFVVAMLLTGALCVRCSPFGAAGDTSADAASDSGPVGDASAETGGCRGTAGPAMVSIADAGVSFCIDATEVTRAQYAAFLLANGSVPSGQPARCAWNTSYTPASQWPPSPSEGALPVVEVDWCDAYAFCAWAGKRLCGSIAGAPLPTSDSLDFTQSRWMYACTAGGMHAYAYGDTFDATRCNTHTAGLVDAGSLPGCVGGFPGIFDMSGNAEEWEDSCDLDAGAGAIDTCRIRGGSFNDGTPASTYACNVSSQSFLLARSTTTMDIGFRCCSP